MLFPLAIKGSPLFLKLVAKDAMRGEGALVCIHGGYV